MIIRFKFNPKKALQAVLWVAQRKPGITFHTMLKVLFYADKKHLNAYGRPVFGDRYRAMQYGPVGSGAYDILKKDALYLEALERDEYPFTVDGSHVHVPPEIQPDLTVFSESDLEILTRAFEENANLGFDALVNKTHADPAYRAVETNGWMDYENLVDDRPDRKEVLADLQGSAHRMVI